jgi:glycosyltransferase involved in cell wall biosynthesis
VTRVAYVFHKSLLAPIPRVHGVSQVEALAGERRFTVISFEGSRRLRTVREWEIYEEIRNRLASRGVRHVALSQTGRRWLDIALGAAALLVDVIFRGTRIVHARSYVPAIMGLVVCSITPARLVFDMRGLFVDEYLFVGALEEGTARLAFFRWIERLLLARSDAVVVVSERFRDHLLARPDLVRSIRRERIHVIPNRVDLARFEEIGEARPRLRDERGWGECTVAVYAGSAGARWHRVDLIMEMMARVMEALPEVRLLVMTYPSTDDARAFASRAGVPIDRTEFLTVDVAEVPALLAAGDVGLMLIDRHVSKDVCAPIKFAEYLAAGLPIAAGGSIGDTEDWIRDDRLGILFDPNRIEDAALGLVEFLRSDDFGSGAARGRCLEFAARRMDARRSLEEYETIYRSMEGR